MEEETKDLLERIENNLRMEKITLLIFMVGVALFLILKKLPYPEYVSRVFILLIIWFLSVYLIRALIIRQKRKEKLNQLYLIHELKNNLLMTLIIFYIGGAEWLGAIFYFFMIIYSANVLPKLESFIVTLSCSILYSGLVIFQYFGILPFRPFFTLGFSNLYRNPDYVLVTLTFVNTAFYLAGWAIGVFIDLFRERTKDLLRAKEDLEETSKVLEIRVRARTRALKELAESLEEKVEKRTKELQEKIKELKKFQELTVGRELKMIKLKEEIKKLQEQLKKGQN